MLNKIEKIVLMFISNIYLMTFGNDNLHKSMCLRLNKIYEEA